MRELTVPFLLAASLCAQTGRWGAFTDDGDVGSPKIKGSAVFDPAKKEYRITAAGANMWARDDQFHYLWRTMPGDFSITATLQFLGEGNAHRKAGIVVRQTLDADSPYADLVIHGNGMPGVQWRVTKGDITNTFDFPFDTPGKFKVKLVRRGGKLYASIAKDGAEWKELGNTEVQFRNPVMAGLAVCSHDPEKSETVVFTDVSVEELARPAGKQ